MKQATIEEISAGGVVYRQDAGKYQFLIGKHSGYHKWVLPKGLVERGESQMEAAVREVMEEVGVEAKIVEMAPLKIIEYYYFADLSTSVGVGANGQDTERRVKKYQEDGGANTRVHKQVIFYLMETQRDLGQSGWEMEDRKWVDFEEGMRMLAFESEKEVLQTAGKSLGIGAPAEI